MDDLESLELLSLVSKIMSELQNHLGIKDKTLAEFVIAQRLPCKSLPEFEKKLSAMGAGFFPLSLIESLDKLIQNMHPVMKSQRLQRLKLAKSQPVKVVEENATRLKGLSMRDTRPEDLLPLDDLALDVLDDGDPVEQKRKRSPNHDRTDDDWRRPAKRDRHRDRDGRDDNRYDVRDDRRDDGQRRGRDRYSQNGHRDYETDKSRLPAREVDEFPILYKVYEGHVTGVKDFGAFVNVHGVRGKVDGLVHVSALVEGQRVNHPSDLVTPGQQVKVKVVKMEGNRIGLSMKDVDQETGLDLAPQLRIQSGANMEALGGGSHDDLMPMSIKNAPVPAHSRRHKKRMTSPERWEIRQLIASGVAKASDYPDLEEDYNSTLTGEGQLELEEIVDIEIRDEEPPFLAGQTKQSLALSPIRVVKAPEGGMNRAAMAGTALTKERKEMKAQQQEVKEQAQKVDLSAQWQDPMADPNRRQFAADGGRGNNNARPEDVPEWRRHVAPKDQALGPRTNMSIKQQRETLPVFQWREKFLEAVRDNQILVVVGETGSGKTTQLTQYLAEAGYTNDGVIGCTQPRRVAAMSVAKRVAEEVGCEVGNEVGYSVRFDDKTNASTRIIYMTDGLLLRTAIMDPDLKRYSVIMLDEAHERTIATDVLFGLLKKTVARRPDLRILVTSATLDADKFSGFFNDSPILKIPGRTFKVEVLYSKEPESDYLDAALMTVMEIHLTEPVGDILVFLTGQDEIDTAAEVLYERMKALGPNVPELIILPVYSALPAEMQSKIFEPAPPGSRKVVIATNIAETSITIDGISYVVDPGFVKQNAYDPKLGMDSLVVVPISQASANQRAGRAGRTREGKCFRLYTEQAFQAEMLPTTIPDIQRQNLQHTILMLKAFGINDLLGFDFMDPPPPTTMLSAMHELYDLSALDDEGLLTRLGRKMADFPMDPALAKTLLGAVDFGCSDEMISIVAMLDVQVSIFYRPKEKQALADQKKAKFHDPNGDHLTLLNVYNSWKQSGFSSAWCFENFIQARGVRRAKDIRDQLVKLMKQYKQPILSCGRDTEKVRRALCGGYFRNSARKDPQEGYKTLTESTNVYMHPSSALFGKNAEWVLYHNLVLTSKEYMHMTTAIDPKWLVEAAPTFFKVASSDQLSKRQKAETIEPLYNKFMADGEWRLSAQRKGGKGGGGGTWG